VVLDVVTARPVDHAGRDGQPGGQREVVVEVGAVLEEVVGAIVGRRARVALKVDTTSTLVISDSRNIVLARPRAGLRAEHASPPARFLVASVQRSI
jgi:hypothetical protein